MTATDENRAWVPVPVVRMAVDAQPASRFGEVPDVAVQASRNLLRAIDGQFREMASAAVRSTITQMLLTKLMPALPRYQQFELQAIAQRMRITLGEALLANVSYDLTVAKFGCSTLALATSEGPVLARNMDWWPTPELARASISLGLVEQDGETLRTENFGWFGVVGMVSGISARSRFAVVLNAVHSNEQANLTGQPVLLFLRHVIETAANFDEARRLLRDTPLVTGALFTLVGEHNHERVVIERKAKYAAEREPESPEAPLVASNDYRAMKVAIPGMDPIEAKYLESTACSRFDRVNELVAASPETFGNGGASAIEDEALLTLLTDKDVIQPITAQHVIARPAKGTARMWVPREYL